MLKSWPRPPPTLPMRQSGYSQWMQQFRLRCGKFSAKYEFPQISSAKSLVSRPSALPSATFLRSLTYCRTHRNPPCFCTMWMRGESSSLNEWEPRTALFVTGSRRHASQRKGKAAKRYDLQQSGSDSRQSFHRHVAAAGR